MPGTTPKRYECPKCGRRYWPARPGKRNRCATCRVPLVPLHRDPRLQSPPRGSGQPL